MSAPLRVPPAIRMRFEQVAHQVCTLARLDYADAPLRAQELVGHLEERWREGAESDLSSEAAEERALRMFGDPIRVASFLRRPILVCLFCFQRYGMQRHVLFYASHALTSWLAIIETHFRSVSRGAVSPIFDMLFPSSYHFWISGMGSFFVGIAALAVIPFVRWTPASRNRWVRPVALVRHSLLVLPLAATLFVLSAPPYMLMRAAKDYIDASGYPIYLALVGTSVVLGWVGALCMIIEASNLPARLSRRRNRNAPFAVAPS